jgi:hypothetical protein
MQRMTARLCQQDVGSGPAYASPSPDKAMPAGASTGQPDTKDAKAARIAYPAGNFFRRLLQLESKSAPPKGKQSRVAQFDAMCAVLEVVLPVESKDTAEKVADLRLKKKLISGLLAKSFEQELNSNKNLKALISTLSVRLQAALSLFVLPDDDEHAQHQKDLIKGFFGEGLEFNYEAGHTGAYDPSNKGRIDGFYQCRYVYDADGEVIAGEPEDRDFLNNSHRFYDLSIIMNMLYATHRIPVKGKDDDGEETETCRFEDLLTRPFLDDYLIQANYGARIPLSPDNPVLTSGIFGTFVGEYERAIAAAAGLSTDPPLSEFYETPWKNGILNFAPKRGNAYVEKALEKDYFSAAGSGTTAGILCAHLRLAALTAYLEKKFNEKNLGGRGADIKLDPQALKQEMLPLMVSLYGWMGLSGDHTLYEAAISYTFMARYCERYMRDDGNLEPIGQEQVEALIAEIQQEDFVTAFLKQLREVCPNAIDAVLDQIDELSHQSQVAATTA